MKILIQRVTQANVQIKGETIASIGAGMVVFIGVTQNDTEAEAFWLANKMVNLRIFEDDMGKMNRSLIDKQGSALIISQFTLYADCNGGNRPSFIKAAQPGLAKELYEYFIAEVKKTGIHTETGIFAANMQVFLINDGPVTIMLER